MARARLPGEGVFQLITAEWRRKALKRLAFERETTMTAEIEAAIDDRLTAAGIPLGNSQGGGDTK